MWDWFVNFLYQVLNLISTAVGDWGLGIILLTFIIRILLTPLTISSTKSSARMQAMQPRIQDIQERYADDPQRQSQEMQDLYREIGFNPVGGCLPLFLQMPVFFALFTVLRDMLPGTASFYAIIPSLGMSIADAVAANGIAGSWIHILLDLLFGVLTFIPMFSNLNSQPAEQRQTTMMMGMVMAVMMVWMGWRVPVGVLLYYDTSSLWGVIQQQFITSRVQAAAKAEAAAAAANAPIKVDVVRKTKKARPHKKG
ncbi:MAG: YidC/Oxa1 family membrane protein insertase [Atopobiaceae bacterium]|nr:YidC/Oxa1 family membrane protein insertase [Olsenella sp.]MBQ6492160.1 YidC/Oxa1 family membrane protein insertase [Atopobiaceae bacterium]